MLVALLRPLIPRDASGFRRPGILALVAALHLLLMALLLRLAPPLAPPSAPAPGLTLIDLMPEAAAPAESEASEAQKETATEREKAQPIPPVPPMPEMPKSDIWSKVIRLNKEELAAADIATMPSHAKPADADGQGERGTSNGDSEIVGGGAGPNGEPLYNAEWQRPPTSAELAFYLPRGTTPQGWGMIACQTVANYRVDNCEEIGQSPVGSGLARAVRQAAWQFRVLPPRIGGRPMVGAWVRIRIDYTVSGSSGRQAE